MTLPQLLVLTDRAQAEARDRRLVDVVAAIAAAGTPAVLFREKDLRPDERRALGTDVAAALHGTATQLFVASDVALAIALGAAGVHLAAADPGSGGLPFGRSCHSRDDLEAAQGEGASWTTLSPIFPTSSKPGYGPALGVNALEHAPLPVFALGGVDAGNASQCLSAGAHGVAVMGSVMGAEDPAAVVAALLAAIASPAARAQ